MHNLVKNGAPLAVLHVDLDGANHIYNAHGWNMIIQTILYLNLE